MVKLTYGENEILVTCSENLPSSNIGNWDSFIEGYFGIYSQVTKQTKWVYVTNTFLYYPRIDSFNITVVSNQGDENLEQGIVYLKENGFYEYSIYTRFENNPSPNTSEILLERGKCLIEFSDATITTYDPNIEVIVYDRQ